MSFVAKYSGPCAEGDRIHPGDEVEYGADSELRHVECTGDDADMARIAPHEVQCTDCFIIHPKGACP